MGQALITDVGSATFAAAGSAAATFAAPMTNTVRNSALTAKTLLAGLWRNGVTKGSFTVSSPNLVRAANGIYMFGPAGNSGRLLSGSPAQPLTPQDTLAVEITATAAESDQVALQTYHGDLPSTGMILKSPGDIAGQAEFVFGWPVSAVAGAAIGQIGQANITSLIDSSSANRWYALLGYVTDTLLTAVGLVGTDTSQLFVGGPGQVDPDQTANYFQDLSVRLGLPCVPCFNAANKGSTNVAAVDVAAATAAKVTLILAQMPDSWQP